MRKILAVLLTTILFFTLCACAAGIDDETARAWTKADWDAASDKERISALAGIIAADRDDVDAKRSAEASIEGFNSFFASQEDATVTLGDIFDSSQLDEIE